MRKNLQQRILALALAAALALTGCAGGQGAASSAAASAPASSAASAPAQAEEEALSPREDFYAYVNAAQLDSWDIPADSTSVSWFTLATDNVTERVTDIVHQVTEVYDARLAGADWLSEDTRAQARTKLKALDVQVGWPETWPQDLYEVVLRTPDEGGVMIDNYMELKRAANEYEFTTGDEPVDKTLWLDWPQTVNAYYNSTANGICLLGGILQAPFYDPDASPEENLGGIGVVIAHEITHAFDTSGAQFDEAGNVRNWWTEEDLAHFQAMADEVAAYYSTFEVNGAPVDGVQTVTENIADLGAVACITEIAQKNGYDLDKLYRAYANLWANKSRPEYLAYQLATDVHSPGEVRVNAVLAAQPAFRELYGIVEGDGMYHEAMPAIW